MALRFVRLIRIALVVTGLLVGVALAEAVLRVSGFRMDSVPIVEVG